MRNFGLLNAKGFSLFLSFIFEFSCHHFKSDSEDSPGAEMFMRMAKLSSCVSSPDCAGPAANSEAVKVRYLVE